MRDPAPAPLDYLKTSGGIFVDQAIHDIDCARYLVGEVEAVHAWGAVRVDPRIGEMGDVDTTNLSLRFANGALGVIQNSSGRSTATTCAPRSLGPKASW
ncbi:Gfo/Idh/MocA family oxidoreductase [Thermus sp. LT1-2-5]|uniref:Gfo/Idh/MocA family protein n=1 Tax=Thermus sp. LT1-2-5 TaxID=3026935 RepID=UPI003365316F